MQRQAFLMPRSREHHRSLRLTRDLQRAELDAAYGQRQNRAAADDLRRHFSEAEKTFAVWVTELPDSLTVLSLLDRMHREHRSLMAIIDVLCADSSDPEREAGSVSRRSAYHTLGQLLAEHIAFEERNLFPALQDSCLMAVSEMPAGVRPEVRRS